MAYYLVVGVGPQTAQPIEHEVATAVDADLHCETLRRLCGRLGTVEVWTKDGRKVSRDKLASLVRNERCAAAKST